MLGESKSNTAPLLWGWWLNERVRSYWSGQATSDVGLKDRSTNGGIIIVLYYLHMRALSLEFEHSYSCKMVEDVLPNTR